MNKFFQILGYLFLALILMALGALGFWYYQNNWLSEEKVETKTEVEVGGLPSQVSPTAGAVVSPELVPSEAERTDEELIAEALAARHSKPVADVELTIDDNTGIHANGGVHFQGEIAGGWWLAYKQAGDWLIVADGNGTVLCTDIEPYNFPIDMVPECWQESSQTLIIR